MTDAGFAEWWAVGANLVAYTQMEMQVARAAWCAATERAAGIVRGYAALDADGCHVRPGLGMWYGESYVPRAEAIAGAIEGND